MSETTEKKYLSYEGLTLYDSQNKEYIQEQIGGLHTVATTGSWDDLEDKPELITEEIMFQLLVEGKVIDPVSDATNQIYTDNNGKVLCL